MAKGQKKKTKKPKKRWRTRTWICGVVPVPLAESALGSAPMLALCVEQPGGLIVGTELLDTTEDSSGPEPLVALVEAAMEAPAMCSPRRPDRFLVSDERQAVALSAAFGLPVRLGPTEVLDALAQELAAQMMGELSGPSPVWSYLANGVTPEMVQALFEAAGRLYHAAPWDWFATDGPLQIDAPHVGLDGACAVVVGSEGESRGVMIFASEDVLAQFMKAAFHDEGLEVPMVSLALDEAQELDGEMRKEILRHGWPVPAVDAHPWVFTLDDEGDMVAPRPADVRQATVVAQAIAELCEALEMAPEDQDDVGEITFEALGGPVRVRELVGQSSEDELELVLTQMLYAYALEQLEGPWMDPTQLFEDMDLAGDLILRWLVYDLDTGGGRSVADRFLETAPEPSEDAVAVFEAQRRAGLGLWEIRSIESFEGLQMVETLSGEERFVTDPEVARLAEVGTSILARVIDLPQGPMLSGVHSQPLAGPFAETVVLRMRKRLRSKGLVPVDRLREPEHAQALVTLFVEQIADQGPDAPEPLLEADSSDLAEPPGASAAIRAFKAAHYDDWTDVPLPALGGLTPREAAETDEGRETLLGLLDLLESGEEHYPPDQRYDFSEVRRELGLD